MKWENLTNSTTARKVHEKQTEAWLIKKKDRRNKAKYIKTYSHNHIKVIIILNHFYIHSVWKECHITDFYSEMIYSYIHCKSF